MGLYKGPYLRVAVQGTLLKGRRGRRGQCTTKLLGRDRGTTTKDYMPDGFVLGKSAPFG